MFIQPYAVIPFCLFTIVIIQVIKFTNFIPNKVLPLIACLIGWLFAIFNHQDIIQSIILGSIIGFLSVGAYEQIKAILQIFKELVSIIGEIPKRN